jgi:hypothetical protein
MRFSAFFVLCAALGLGCGCSSDRPDPTPVDCPASKVCPAGTASSLVAGDRSGDQLTAFTDGQGVQIVFGPQGGQHFFVDLDLTTDEPGQWMAQLSFIDSTSGIEAGGTQQRISACACPAQADDVRVFLNDASERTGTLKAKATSPSGVVVSAPDVTLAVKKSL